MHHHVLFRHKMQRHLKIRTAFVIHNAAVFIRKRHRIIGRHRLKRCLLHRKSLFTLNPFCNRLKRQRLYVLVDRLMRVKIHSQIHICHDLQAHRPYPRTVRNRKPCHRRRCHRHKCKKRKQQRRVYTAAQGAIRAFSGVHTSIPVPGKAFFAALPAFPDIILSLCLLHQPPSPRSITP